MTNMMIGMITTTPLDVAKRYAVLNVAVYVKWGVLKESNLLRDRHKVECSHYT